MTAPTGPVRRRTLRTAVMAALCAVLLAPILPGAVHGAPEADPSAESQPQQSADRPTDPQNEQRDEQRTDPVTGPGQWYISEFGIDALWEETTGAGVTVAVIDSGVDDSHENLDGAVAAAKDFSGSGTDGRTPVGPAENIHHGTAVAGTIVGNGTGAGPRGVAPDARLLSASMWLGPGRPDGTSSSRTQAAQALRWAVDEGADIVNMSLGWDDPTWTEDWDEAFAYAYAHDVLIVACVGNASQGARQAWSPSTVPGVLGVGGLGRDGRHLPAASAPGTAVDLLGPAEDIPVPFYSGGYAQAQGCSFAAPIVAGVAALLRSARPELSADETAALLTTTASMVPGHEGRSTWRAPDPIVGWGRVEPQAALAAAVPAQVRSAQEDLADWVTMHRRAQAPTTDPQEPAVQGPEQRTPQAEPAGAARAPSTAGPAILIGGGALSAVLLLLAAGSWLMARRRSAAAALTGPGLHAAQNRPGDGSGDRPADRTADGPGESSGAR